MDGYNILYLSFCRTNPTLMLLSFLRKSAQWHFNDNQCKERWSTHQGTNPTKRIKLVKKLSL